ncbi:putative transmembrane protein precursor domain-containing protein [Ditylenchus destructor]|nr:putative transmembrane protein precursor domain-containing protein [Ditylenchus destructor]
MELGLSAAEFGAYGFIGSLLALCVVFPPQEFNSAGFTIPKIFQSFLGDDRFNFVEYQLRRTCLTIFIHSMLPLFFCIALELAVHEPIFSFYPHNFIQYFSTTSLLLVIGIATAIFLLFHRNWEHHYMVKYLQRLNPDWRVIVDEINSDIREPMIYSINYNAYSKVVVTAHWLIRISNYNVLFAPIADSSFFVTNSHNHPYLSNENNGMHLIDIRVQSVSNRFDPFTIRVHSQEMLDTLRDQLGRPIEILDTLSLPQALHDRFVEAFLQNIEANHRYPNANKENIDPCLGCSSTLSNVKLVKNCMDAVILDNTESNCQSCNCRPMWCARCMGRIFASKQDQRTPEIWMSGRAPCPTCRALFCVLDVCYLE